jgi:hypothetical protein
MKNKLFIVILFLEVLMTASCVKQTHYTDLDRLVTFNKPYDSFGKIKKEKLPVSLGLKLPKSILNSSQDTRELWTWVFLEGAKPIFKDVVIIDKLGEIDSPSSVDLAMKPELWSVPHCLKKGCVYSFKFRFYDKYGNKKVSIISEGRTRTGEVEMPLVGWANYDDAKAQALDEMMRRFQYMVLQRKEEILSIAQGNEQ